MITFKEGVDCTKVSRRVWWVIYIADYIYEGNGAKETVVTSLRDGEHMQGSKHYEVPCNAVDLRIWNIPEGKREDVYRQLKGYFTPEGYDVVFEKTHFHIEYDPS